MSSEDGQKVQFWCNHCMTPTWHERFARHTQSGVVEYVNQIDGSPSSEIEFATTFDVFACRGCDEVTVRRTVDSEVLDYPEKSFVPPRVTRRRPHWGMGELPFNINDLHAEVYSALQAGALRLARWGPGRYSTFCWTILSATTGRSTNGSSGWWPMGT